MFMPKLGTMHRRNSLPAWIVIGIAFVLVAGLALSGLALAQTAVGQASSTPSPAPPAGQAAAPPNQPAAASPNPQTQAPQSQTPAPEQAPSALAPSGQAPADQPPNGAQTTAPQTPPPAAQAPAAKPPAGSSAGESPTATNNGVFVFRKEVDEVTLHATVVDDKNHILTNLDRSAFSVFENDQPQQIKSFRREDYPVAMGIVIDNSGSMREKRDQVNKAALNLVRSSNPQDQVFIVNFNDEYYLDQEFTSDIKKLQTALEKVEARGATALYDAIVASWTDELAHSPLQRKVIFVVTDGADDASELTLEQALHTLQQENGPVVYAIGLLPDEGARKARRALQMIADRTGGLAFFPPTLGQVDDISKTVAHDIRNQYTITYAPTTPQEVPGFRTVRIEAHAKGYKKLSVRTRAGYFPGQEH
jgi:Ca-activated chloride channel family protein